MREKIMTIINNYMRKKGLDKYNEFSFYERIQKELARKVKLNAPDPRDAIRAMWTTVENQEKHYHAWVNFLIDYGFGRAATEEEIEEGRGYVILFANQVRICFFCSFMFSCIDIVCSLLPFL